MANRLTKLWNGSNSMAYSNFRDFLLNDFANRMLLWSSIILLIVQFVIFKYFYPFAGFINGDSYVYLESAYHNFTVNTYPIGYPKFLRLFSVFTHSDYVLVAFQYMLLQLSLLSLIFTLFYFYSPSKIAKAVLLIITLFNPVALYLANYISSDSFFLSLSIIWFTLLLWIMNRPSTKLIIINAIILFVAFTVRYNALYYPLIGAVALMLVKNRVLMNLVGYCISIVLIVCFINVASNKYREISGKKQFTPFTGWQLANNALYAYRFVDSLHRRVAPSELQELDSTVREYFDSSRDVKAHPVESLIASTVYMWDPRSPLTIYMNNQFINDSISSSLKKWSTVSPLYKKYGFFLIKTYPTEFAKYYLVPNAIKYYVPPVEFLGSYSTGVDSVNEMAKVWFDYKSIRLHCRFKDFKVDILNFYPVLTGTMNGIFVLSLIGFVFTKGYKYNLQLKRALILVVALWVVNFGFSVFSSPIALRFQLFPILVSIYFTVLLLDHLIISAFRVDKDQKFVDHSRPVDQTLGNINL